MFHEMSGELPECKHNRDDSYSGNVYNFILDSIKPLRMLKVNIGADSTIGRITAKAVADYKKILDSLNTHS